MGEPFAETVIGSERVAMILQEASSVFDIDQYRPLIQQIDSFVTKPKVNGSKAMESKRVIADHMKALYILVKDGAPPPGKNGRERIIKLLIRGVVTRQLLLNIQSRDYLPALLKTIARLTNDCDQDSLEVQKRVMTYYTNEAERFLKTVQRGQHQLERFLEENDEETLSGSQILFLEKRKGLPHLLSEMMLRERGLNFLEIDYRGALDAWEQKTHN
jgi:alanyl-tRNA synthetase